MAEPPKDLFNQRIPLEQERGTVAVWRFRRSRTSGRPPLWQAGAVLAAMASGVRYVLTRPSA